MTRRQFSTIVVGAGPAGSACATMLARNGLSVLLIDKARFPREKICGDCIHPSSWQFFESLRVADELLHAGIRRIRKVRIVNTRGDEVSVSIPAEPSRPFFSVKRSVLDAVLLEHAKRAGVEVLEEGTVSDISRTIDWNVDVRTVEGTMRVQSSCLVGADGRNSIVAAKICTESRKSPFTGTGNRVGVQWHTPFQPAIGPDVLLFKFGSGYGGVVNVDAETANIAIVTDPGLALLAGTDFPRFLAQTVHFNPRCADLLDQPFRLHGIRTTFPINPVLRRSDESNSAFLVGDARRTVEPFTGQGVYFALQDGVHAAGRILKKCGRQSESIRVPVRGSFWVNRFFSPILRSHVVAETAIRIASTRPWLTHLMKIAVFDGAPDAPV